MAAVRNEVLEKIEANEVDIALEAWARWAKQALSGLGWPAVSLLARVIEYGVRGAAQTSGVRLVEVDSLCEMVDRAIVLRLKLKERRVLVTWYTQWSPRETAAEACGVTPEHFRVILHRARRSVADFLEGARLRY